MNWRKGTLQKLADPGTGLTRATHSFAGNDPLKEALAPSWSVSSVTAHAPGFLGLPTVGLLEADHLTLGVKVLHFEQWAGAVRPGDLILWGCSPDRTGRTKAGNAVALRRALLIVTRVVGSGVAVRLLQDWGGVE